MSFTYPIKKTALKKIRGHENLHKIVTTTEIKKTKKTKNGNDYT
eukprot:SAG11_NODE_34674_length_270_cov_1.514620_1_plen_43_part_10